MIKINLLPSKKKPARKITELQQQMLLAVLILALSGTGMGMYWQSLSSKIAGLKQAKLAAEAKIKQQESMLKEVQSVEEERKKVLEKIDTIKQLKKNQDFLVRLMDEVSKALPPGVNIVSLTEKAGKVDFDGTAFSNNDIVRFVENLKTSAYLHDVNLQETVQATVEGIDVYKYKMQLTFKGV
ncbi:MAG: hypothetical protein A2078_10190 [Nitrospirae bacterium GWC2_57_9]|nr:MAG: hypothetical protein A2078_10190 [Nitrospirae bacterium GWC2_57_9]